VIISLDEIKGTIESKLPFRHGSKRMYFVRENKIILMLKLLCIYVRLNFEFETIIKLEQFFISYMFNHKRLKVY